MNRLQNKTAIITGGNSGIGFATAKEFIAQGAILAQFIKTISSGILNNDF